MIDHLDTASSRRRDDTAHGSISTRARVVLAVGALALLGLAAAACGSSNNSAATTRPSTTSNTSHTGSSTGSSTGAGDTVKTASTSAGTILVNSAGMALYTYGPDHGSTQSACMGPCLQAWPPLTVPAGTTPHGAPGVSGTLATAQQSNGALQVTYNGALLYTFVSDTSPGQVTGNGVAGFSVAKPSTSSTQAGASGGSSPAGTTTTKSGGTTTTKGGYGY